MGGRRRKRDGQAPVPHEVEISPGLPRGFEAAYDDPRVPGPASGAGAYAGYPDAGYGDDAHAAPGYGGPGHGGGYGRPWADGGHDPDDHGTGYDATGYDATGYDDPPYDDPPYADPGPADAGYEAAGTDLDVRVAGAPGVRGRDGAADPTVPAPRGAADDLHGPAGGRAPRPPSVPIWHPPGLVPAVLTGGLAVLLAATALAGGPAPLVGTAVLQVLTAAGWFRLNGMWPARQGIALAAVAGFAALGAVELAGANALRVVPGVLAGAMLLVLTQQLIRRDGRAELMPALTVTASATLVTVLDVAYMFAADLERPGVDTGAVVASGVAAVAVAVLVASLPVPAPVGAIGGFVAGTAVGAGAGIVLGIGGNAAALAAGAAVAGLAGRAAAGYDHPSRFVHMTAGVALPLALAAPVVYLLGRVVVG